MEQPSISEIREAAGISQSYASMILSGARTPSRPLAIHIFRQTGWKHPTIAELSEEQIALLEEVEPYRPKPNATPSGAEAA